MIYAALVWAVTTIKVQRKPDHAGNGFGLRLLLQDSSNWSDTESSKLTFHTFQIFKPMRNKRKFSWNLKVLYFLITRCQKDASNRILPTTAQLLKLQVPWLSTEFLNGYLWFPDLSIHNA